MKTILSFSLTSAVMSLGAYGSDLPQHLKDEAVIWLDANVNLVRNADGGVTEWRDVREVDTSSAAVYPKALTYLPEPATAFSAVPPTLYDDTEGLFGGKALVDFGEYFSGKWVYFARPDNVITQLPVCAVAGVVGFHGNSYGFLLGDISSFSAYGGKSYFRKSTDSQADTYIANSSSAFCKGETRIDGSVIDPAKTKYAPFQVFSQNGPRFYDDDGEYVHPCASTLFNDRNYKKSTGQQDRQGGGIVGELLVFDRPLSAAERRAVDEYLSVKWFGRSCPGTDAEMSEPVTRLDPSSIVGTTVYATNGVTVLSPAPSAGDPVAETFLAPSENLAEDFGDITVYYDTNTSYAVTTTKWFQVTEPGIYRVSMIIARDTEGEEADGELVAEINLDSTAAQYYHAVQEDPRGGRDVPKTYSFTLPYITVGEHRMTFSMRRAGSVAYRAYTASDITITPVKTGEFVPVKDSGFDSTVNRIYAAANAWYLRRPDTGTPWTFSPTTSCGITLYSSYWWWEAGFKGEFLSDMRRCFLSENDYVTQILNVARAGRVRLSFRYANRGNTGNAASAIARPVGHSIFVSVGGTEVASAYPQTQQNRICSAEFDIAAGEQELKILVNPAEDESLDCAAIVDDVMIEYVDGIAPSSSRDYTVSAETDGWYRLVVEAAGPVVDRQGAVDCITGNAAGSPVTATVSVDGEVAGTLTAKSDSFFSYVFTLPRLSAGEHAVTVSNAGELRLRVRKVALEAVTDAVPLDESSVDGTTFVVDAPGKLYLDFIGTLGGCYLKIDGTKVNGMHSASTDGVHFLGSGTLDGAVRGLVIGIR